MFRVETQKNKDTESLENTGTKGFFKKKKQKNKQTKKYKQQIIYCVIPNSKAVAV